MLKTVRWASVPPVASLCMFAFLCLSATLSVAERVVAQGVPVASLAHAATVVISPASEMTSDGLFAVAATINGADVDALVDTGSSSVVLSYKDAMLAGIRPETLKFNQSVMTSRGITQAARVKIYHVTVEDIVVHDIDGMVMPKGTLDGTLLGMSFLNRLNGLQASIKSYPFDH